MPDGLVKQLLKSRGSSVAWLGRKVDISRTGLTRRLDGRIAWKDGEAERVAEALDIPVELVRLPASSREEAVA